VAGQLQPRVQIEQKIQCTEVEKATGPTCAPDAPMCDAGLYCLPVGAAFHCEPCPERDTIRHDFKERDFLADQVRDPFQSYVIVQPELVEKGDKKIEQGPCTRKEQFVATNYSYMDLRLVGIVSQGTQRKVLMMDRGNLGHIIRRGDCVGKEKAVVKDIGTGYVTFVVAQDPEGRNANQPPEEFSMQLHPKTLDIAPTGEVEGPAPSAPLVAPPGGGATAPTISPTPAPANAGSATR
jgi:Tfp pilus assembly protein PilP